MTYTPDYTLELPDGKKIELLFRNRAALNYSIKKGIELDELTVRVYEMLTKGRTVSLHDMPALLWAGHECYCYYNDIPFTATDKDADIWVDEAGGIVLGMNTFIDIYSMFLSKWLRTDIKAFASTEQESKEEKKSHLKKTA